MLPQSDAVKAKGFEVLYCTDDVDEFAIQMMRDYEGKTFTNICADKLDLDTEEEKKALEDENNSSSDLLEAIKTALDGKVSVVRFTNKLHEHPVCLTSEGMLSLEMEKVLNSMPNGNTAKAELVLEINHSHPIAEKLKALFDTDKEKLAKYAKILYAEACLISGKGIENPAEFSELVCELM